MTRRQWWTAAVLLVGIAARFVVAARGHNFDIDSYRIVGEIVHHHGSVYNETYRYNYGPVWFWVVGALYRVTIGAGLGFLWFRYAITGFLTLVDVGIAAILDRRFGGRTAVLFFLNPVTILITGYHSQFDNFAILVALIATLILLRRDGERGLDRGDVDGLLLLGLSLAIKHIVILMPLWVAYRRRGALARLVALAVPPAVFLLFFAPYWHSSRRGIIDHVFKYKSQNITPLVAFFLKHAISFNAATALMLSALVVAGFLLRNRVGLDEALLIYLLITVTLAPSIANQYLAIPIAAVALYFNPPFALYCAYATVFLMKDYDGLHIARIPEAFHRGAHWEVYQYLVVLLAAGAAWQLGPALRGWSRAPAPGEAADSTS